MIPQLKLSRSPCRCGWYHELDAFKPGQRVRVLPLDEQENPAVATEDRAIPALIHGSRFAKVREWSQYGSPVYVRVEFFDGSPERERQNFYPCELEHA